jgi:hypothetical protein
VAWLCVPIQHHDHRIVSRLDMPTASLIPLF